MAEPRARQRTRGQFFSTTDLSELLFAFGDNTPSLPATVTVLDEILTDFIIETCHAAALSASYSRRQKLKVDDFKFLLRKDPTLLGRVLEQMWKDKGMKEERKAVDVDDLQKEALGLKDLVGTVDVAGAGGEVRKKGRRGRKRKVAEDGEGSPEAKRGRGE
jgi:transcription initiation factor TFIID subunit 13